MLIAYQACPRRRLIDLASEDVSLLHAPYPKRQCSIQREVYEDSPKRSSLGFIPTQFIVRVESHGGDKNSAISQSQSYIRQVMGLLEFERGKVIGKGIIRCVFEICSE